MCGCLHLLEGFGVAGFRHLCPAGSLVEIHLLLAWVHFSFASVFCGEQRPMKTSACRAVAYTGEAAESCGGGGKVSYFAR